MSLNDAENKKVGQSEPRCMSGDTVSFTLRRVDDPANWKHVFNARNVNFADLIKQNF